MLICAPFAGVVRYHVQPGQQVAAGDIIATVEATKLESPVATPGPGIVAALTCEEYSDVIGGDALAEIAALDGNAQAASNDGDANTASHNTGSVKQDEKEQEA